MTTKGAFLVLSCSTIGVATWPGRAGSLACSHGFGPVSVLELPDAVGFGLHTAFAPAR